MEKTKSTTHKEVVYEVDCITNAHGGREPKHTSEMFGFIALEGAWHELMPNGKFITVVNVKNEDAAKIKDAKEIKDSYREDKP